MYFRLLVESGTSTPGEDRDCHTSQDNRHLFCVSDERTVNPGARALQHLEAS